MYKSFPVDVQTFSSCSQTKQFVRNKKRMKNVFSIFDMVHYGVGYGIQNKIQMATVKGNEASVAVVIQCWRSKETCVCFAFDSYADHHQQIKGFRHPQHHQFLSGVGRYSCVRVRKQRAVVMVKVAIQSL